MKDKPPIAFAVLEHLDILEKSIRKLNDSFDELVSIVKEHEARVRDIESRLQKAERKLL